MCFCCCCFYLIQISISGKDFIELFVTLECLSSFSNPGPLCQCSEAYRLLWFVAYIHNRRHATFHFEGSENKDVLLFHPSSHTLWIGSMEKPCSCITPLQVSFYAVPFYVPSPWHSHCHHHSSRHRCCFPNSHKRLHWSPTLSSIFCPVDGVVFLKHTFDYVISSSNLLWFPVAPRIKSRFLRSSFRALRNLAFSVLITYYCWHLLDLSHMNCIQYLCFPPPSFIHMFLLA